MVSAHIIYAAIIALGACFAERNDPRVPAHLERVAVAVSIEARDFDEAAALLAIAESESAFSIRVQAGPTGSGGLSDWQLEGKTGKYPGPFVGLELEPIRNAAHAAVSVYRHSWQCGPTFADRATAYAARQCGTEWPTLKARVASFRYARGVMWREARAT
jgi:hypothetical protein